MLFYKKRLLEALRDAAKPSVIFAFLVISGALFSILGPKIL
jgi:hypothetical protein